MASKSIDWSQLWYPGPNRPFTAEDMQRAGGEGPGATLQVVAGLNAVFIAFGLLQVAPAAMRPLIAAVMLAQVMLGYAAARWLWWRPWRRPLMQVSVVLTLLCLLTAAGVRALVPEREQRQPLVMLVAVAPALLSLMLWFLVVWRAKHIEGRLKELAERERAIEMARRLAAAQLEPHFLFNSLASLQHWVQTQDPRASPLLASLTGYLRATLPLFSRALHPASDELHAARLYLEVMQARLGTRLQWQVDVEPAALAQQLPPGLLLTLVENAVGHGIEPLLSGGRVELRGRVEGLQTVFEVLDNGPGPGTDPRDGIGLANNRERLALTCGSDAQLSITALPTGGCRACVSLPTRS